MRLVSRWKLDRLVRTVSFRWSTNVEHDTLRRRQFDNVHSFRESTSCPTVARVRPTHSSSTILCLDNTLRPSGVNLDASGILTCRSLVVESSNRDRLRSLI